MRNRLREAYAVHRFGQDREAGIVDLLELLGRAFSRDQQHRQVAEFRLQLAYQVNPAFRANTHVGHHGIRLEAGPHGLERFDAGTRAGAPPAYLLERAGREFVVNLSPESLFDQMVDSSEGLPHGQSEFAHTGLRETPSTVVRPPRVAGTPVAFECRVHDILPIGANTWIMGNVVHVHIDEAVYVGTRGEQRHRVDLLENLATRPVGRLGRAHYVRLREIETRLRKDGPN